MIGQSVLGMFSFTSPSGEVTVSIPKGGRDLGFGSTEDEALCNAIIARVMAGEDEPAVGSKKEVQILLDRVDALLANCPLNERTAPYLRRLYLLREGGQYD